MSKDSFLSGVKTDLLALIDEYSDDKLSIINEREREIVAILDSHSVRYEGKYETVDEIIDVFEVYNQLCLWAQDLGVTLSKNDEVELLKVKYLEFIEEKNKLFDIDCSVNAAKSIIEDYDIIKNSILPERILSKRLSHWNLLKEIGKKYPEYGV